MKKKIDGELLTGLIMLTVVVGLLIGMICLLSNTLKEKEEFEAWYSSLSAEEQAEYEAPYTTVYEVVAIDKYNVDITNRFGAVRGTYLCYEFHYVDENGDIVTVHDFRDDWGSEDVVIGDANTFTTNSRTKTKTLTITIETLQSLSGFGSN